MFAVWLYEHQHQLLVAGKIIILNISVVPEFHNPHPLKKYLIRLTNPKKNASK